MATCREIDSILTAKPGTSTLNGELTVVLSAFKLAELRRELIALFTACEVNPFLFTGFFNWRAVLDVLFTDLADRPIIFAHPPDDRATKQVYERILRRHLALGRDGSRLISHVYITDRRAAVPVPGRPPGSIGICVLGIDNHQSR